ncbi:uncharacterized protein LOC123557880 isoform X5 [Mercenaria mercenaria]|uniref:uncharacterized protein LOC123557880 isoform X5 n=1 Tax=Mercenaria mercenaria TaxID=6596 RepID=UPI00234E98D3|nr:uncharacterized protein LOC123557880 isoform X5 [Mercenaria mercenaria]
MADLTEEQKIIIGVCVGVAGLILIAICVFICCIFYARDRRRRRNGYKDELIVDRYDNRYDNRYDKYPVYEKEVPAVIIDPPPPPPPPMWREPVYHKRPRSIEVPYKYDTWDKYSLPPRKYSDNRYNSGYRNEPIFIPMTEPEYVTSRAPRREPDTIYLKRSRPIRYILEKRDDIMLVNGRIRYVSDNARDTRKVVRNDDQVNETVQMKTRYVDDQALLSRSNHARRSDYYGGAPLRRSRSFHDARGASAYVGEWGKRPEYPLQFNERALREGKDPYLWS